VGRFLRHSVELRADFLSVGRGLSLLTLGRSGVKVLIDHSE